MNLYLIYKYDNTFSRKNLILVCNLWFTSILIFSISLMSQLIKTFLINWAYFRKKSGYKRQEKATLNCIT